MQIKIIAPKSEWNGVVETLRGEYPEGSIAIPERSVFHENDGILFDLFVLSSEVAEVRGFVESIPGVEQAIWQAGNAVLFSDEYFELERIVFMGRAA